MYENWTRLIAPFSKIIDVGDVFIALLLTLLVLSPILFWLSNGWAAKRSEVRASLSDAAKHNYLKAFRNASGAPADAAALFDQFYDDWYGRGHYALPTILLATIAFHSSLSLIDTAYFQFYSAQTEPSYATLFYALPPVAASSFAGAYTFVVWDLITRAQRRDMTSHDVTANALRLAVCIPVGYVLAAATITPDAGIRVVVAFAVGVFPVNAISAILRRKLSKWLDLDDASDIESDRTVKLAGVDVGIADRLLEADVTTISQLAYCDPVQMTMRTNLSFDYVIDIVSQALAWIYVGDKLNELRPCGLRGAFEIAVLNREMACTDAAVAARAEAALLGVVAKLGMDRGCTLNLFHEIADDPRTTFLLSAYNRGGQDG